MLVVSFWNRNDFASDMEIIDNLNRSPVQTEILRSEFSVSAGDRQYFIQPLYDYELYGLVVSYQHHNGKYGLHKSWGDSLNVADVCVVWSNNAFDIELNKLTFWNGQFTCNVKTSDDEVWRHFNMDQLSNNHLLTNDSQIRDVLDDIRVGDQVRIKGWLSGYRNDQGFKRGTSTTRTDKGNGACETIFVTEIERLVSYSSRWRDFMYLMFVLFFASLTWYFLVPPRVK